MMTLPQDRFSRSTRRFWPGGTALLLSTAVHAAALPIAGVLWVSQPAPPPQTDSMDVILAWESPVADSPAEPGPPAPTPPRPSVIPAPPRAAAPAPIPAASRRLTHAASHVIDTPAPTEVSADSGQAPAAEVAARGGAATEPPQIAALPPPAKAELLARYSRLLLGQLERFKTYPALSQRRGEEGTILLRLTLAEDGRLLHAEPVGEGHERLIQASLTAVQAASPFPGLPEELNSRQLVFDLPITYQLR